MKKLLIGVAAAGMFIGSVFAAQDTTLSNRQVRDPLQLEVILEANATDAESRLASLEGGSTVGSVEPGYLIVGNASTVGVDVVVSGDITMANDGTVAIAAGSIINADVKSDAAIAYSKLALTASVAPADVAEGIVVSPTSYSGTGVKVQFGTVPTNATGTITFADAFTAAPAIVMGAEADPGATVWYVESVTASNFVYNKTADVLGGYIAVGLK